MSASQNQVTSPAQYSAKARPNRRQARRAAGVVARRAARKAVEVATTPAGMNMRSLMNDSASGPPQPAMRQAM